MPSIDNRATRVVIEARGEFGASVDTGDEGGVLHGR